MTGGVQDLTYFYFTLEGTVQFDQDIPIGSGYYGDGSSDAEVTLKAGTVYKVSDLVAAGTNSLRLLLPCVVVCVPTLLNFIRKATACLHSFIPICAEHRSAW